MEMHKIKVWVEAMGEVREAIIDTELTLDEWRAMTEKEREEFVEVWAYNEVQMGYGYEEVE